MSFTATARRIGDTLQHEVDVNGRHTIITDEPESLGGPAPHELLAATLASCVSTLVALYAQRKAWDIGEISVDVLYENEAEPRRFDVTLHLPEGLDRSQVDRLRRVAATCPVRKALESEFAFVEHTDLGGPVMAAA